MKYRLLKDKIGYLEWYTASEKHPEILKCYGFHDGPVRKEYIDILPDIVEEFKPTYTVEFDEGTMHKTDPSQFYFKSEKKAIRMPGGIWEIREYPNQYVGFRREWVEPIVGYTAEEFLQNPVYRPYHPLVWVDIEDWGKKNE